VTAKPTMTPSELETISQALLPGASRNKRADRIGELTGVGRRMVYYWLAGTYEVPALAQERLRAEYKKALRCKCAITA
jgi:hypothetical protein